MMQYRQRVFGALVVCSIILFTQHNLFAAGIEWSGLYRAEAYGLSNVTLDDGNKVSRDYGLTHLTLRPKIVAADGLTIQGRLELLNTSGLSSQHGSVFGGSIGGTGGSGTDNAETSAQTQKQESVTVSQLYLTHVHEFGSFVVGRVPLQFGFGITHNAGLGDFDHWYDTRDLVGYKWVMGNLVFMVSRAKQIENNLAKNEDDINEWNYHFQYENPETDLTLGVFYSVRDGNSVAVGNDTNLPIGTGSLGGTGATLNGELQTKTLNVFAQRDRDNFRFGVEASFQEGQTGARTVDGDDVSLGGYAVISELEIRPSNSRSKWGLGLGIVTGDDATTDTDYEGYHVDRNYDVAMLMFNQPLGQSDVLGTSVSGGQAASGTPAYNLDNENITNATFVAPYWKFQWKPSWALGLKFILAQLREDALNAESDLNLGFETDFSITYKPHDNLRWVTEIGWLQPGDAWVGGSNNFDTSSAIGFTTKAAISF